MAEGLLGASASAATATDVTNATSPLATTAAATANLATATAAATANTATVTAAVTAAALNALKVQRFDVSLIHAAGTFDIATATGGDMWVEIEVAQVTVAAIGLTSALLTTNHTTPKVFVASTLLAALLLDSLLAVAVPKFLLPSGKKLQVTIVGTGSAGNIAIIAKTAPASVGGTLV